MHRHWYSVSTLDVVPASAENWDSDPFVPLLKKTGKSSAGVPADMQGGICAAAQALVDIARV